eukprot:8170957-Ditylum_brightwellii.AAC.1
MEQIGFADCFALVNNQVLDVIADLLKGMAINEKIVLASFVHEMNIIRMIASSEVGLKQIDSKNIAPVLVEIYCKVIESCPSADAIRSYTSAIVVLSKNINMRSTFVAFGLDDYLYKSINAHPFDEL